MKKIIGIGLALGMFALSGFAGGVTNTFGGGTVKTEESGGRIQFAFESMAKPLLDVDFPVTEWGSVMSWKEWHPTISYGLAFYTEESGCEKEYGRDIEIDHGDHVHGGRELIQKDCYAHQGVAVYVQTPVVTWPRASINFGGTFVIDDFEKSRPHFSLDVDLFKLGGRQVQAGVYGMAGPYRAWGGHVGVARTF